MPHHFFHAADGAPVHDQNGSDFRRGGALLFTVVMVVVDVPRLQARLTSKHAND